MDVCWGGLAEAVGSVICYFNTQHGELRKAKGYVMFGTHSLMKLETTWIKKRYNFRLILI
jgi:hypothetical protein